MPEPVRLPSLDGLRAFEAAARLGSFERAADELHLTASAIGKRVAVLEELLGTTLVQRGARALALTAAGSDYLAQVAPLLAQLLALPQHRRGGAAPERLRVCVPPTFARQVLVPNLEAFTSAHPAVELELQLSLPQLDLAATDADVELRFGRAASGRPLLREQVLPMATPALRSRLPGLDEPAALQGLPLLRSPLEPWAPWFAAAGLAWPEPASGPRFADLGLLLEAAVAGQGVALLRPSLARHALDGGALVPMSRISAEPAHHYYLLPVARDHRPARLFAEWLEAVCERLEQASRAPVSGLA
jgi:LysR family transcriptional regulator, glycine cleavage system transcriptional activator